MVDDAQSHMQSPEQTTAGIEQRAEETVEGVQRTAQEMSEQAGMKAKELGAQVQERTRELSVQMQEQAKTTLEQRKSMMASELEAIARAFRETGDHLREQNHHRVANYSTMFAERVENMSSYLQNQNVDSLMHDAEGVARRQPELFLGGMFGLGLLAARFLKSSGTQQGQQRMAQPPQTHMAMMESPESLPGPTPGQPGGMS